MRALHLALLLASATIAEASSFSIRDSATGSALRGRVLKLSSDSAVATAAGHRSLPLELRDEPNVIVWLDPIAPPAELRPEAVRARLRADATLLHGHVTDEATGAVLAGATVRVRSAGVETKTVARGYFALSVPTFPRSSEELPDADDLSIEHDGYRQHQILNTMLHPGADTHFIVQLAPGRGTTMRRDDHKIWLHRDGGEHPVPEETFFVPRSSSFGADGGAEQTNNEARATDNAQGRRRAVGRSARPPAVTVPQSIRVGFNCPTASGCTTVEVFSMQTYVKRGLNDEWIASWHSDSLRAGAVAYRSYGAWYVNHPRTATYDICSTTSCQVNDADTSVAASAAVDATDGVVLIAPNGEIFRSEYSAENNAWDDPADNRSCSNADRSCGDGFAGSPAANWPCLPDPVCTGFGCYGHGRGMCQWGSQRWALQGRDWRWILDHYYNANGTPGGLRSATVWP